MLELDGEIDLPSGAIIKRTSRGWELRRVWEPIDAVERQDARADVENRDQVIRFGEHRLRVWVAGDGAVRFDVDDRAALMDALAAREAGSQAVALDEDSIAEAERACRVTLAQVHSLVLRPGEQLPNEPWAGAPVDVLVGVQERLDLIDKVHRSLAATSAATDADRRECRFALAQIHALATNPGSPTPTEPWGGYAADVVMAVRSMVEGQLEQNMKATAAADRSADVIELLQRRQLEPIRIAVGMPTLLRPGHPPLTIDDEKIVEMIGLIQELAEGDEHHDELQRRAVDILRPQAANGAH